MRKIRGGISICLFPVINPIDFKKEKIEKVVRNIADDLKEKYSDIEVTFSESRFKEYDLILKMGENISWASVRGKGIEGKLIYQAAYAPTRGWVGGASYPGLIRAKFDVSSEKYKDVKKVLKKNLRPITSLFWS